MVFTDTLDSDFGLDGPFFCKNN